MFLYSAFKRWIQFVSLKVNLKKKVKEKMDKGKESQYNNNNNNNKCELFS